MNKGYEQFKVLMQSIADIDYAAAVLSWDREVMMPSGGFARRSAQLATLSQMSHRQGTSKELGQLIGKLEASNDLDEVQRANVREAAKAYRKAQKYPESFVRRHSLAVSEAFDGWNKAREAKDWQLFSPALDKLIQVKREACELLGYADKPLDALLDEYEPEATCALLEPLFGGVREQLKPVLDKILAAPVPEDGFLHRKFPAGEQWDMGIDVIGKLGYDFSRGRQDRSAHPFTTNFCAGDVRITTRVDENNFSEMLWSCIHECGHALYEQGLPDASYGLAAGSYLSLGIHESQSRLWENHVGRSRAFCHWYFPELHRRFPKQFKDISADQFYNGINKVLPSLVRTAADELTYHFHVMIRYEIEKAIFNESVKTDQLRDMWHDLYRSYLGVSAPDDRSGILQDIHWAHGSFGYFPTYSLGSFYAAQFYASAEKAVKGLDEQIATGHFGELLLWLRNNIHRHGRVYAPETLCRNVTGEGLSFEYFYQYIIKKYSEIYQIELKH